MKKQLIRWTVAIALFVFAIGSLLGLRRVFHYFNFNDSQILGVWILYSAVGSTVKYIRVTSKL